LSPARAAMSRIPGPAFAPNSSAAAPGSRCRPWRRPRRSPARAACPASAARDRFNAAVAGFIAPIAVGGGNAGV